MIRRCSDPKHKQFRDYGARGIRICDAWNSYESFMDDMGERPSSKHTLERIDNEGNYEPANCRWATMKEQAQNRRNTRNITIDGRTMSISAWAEESSVPLPTIYARLVKYGWVAKEAVFRPRVPSPTAIGAKRQQWV